MTVLVQMTEKEARGGGRGSSWACPLARAIGRTLGGECSVTKDRVLISVPGSPYLVSTLPPKARRWLVLFDHEVARKRRAQRSGKVFKPIPPLSFDVPDPMPLYPD